MPVVIIVSLRDGHETFFLLSDQVIRWAVGLVLGLGR